MYYLEAILLLWEKQVFIHILFAHSLLTISICFEILFFSGMYCICILEHFSTIGEHHIYYGNNLIAQFAKANAVEVLWSSRLVSELNYKVRGSNPCHNINVYWQDFNLNLPHSTQVR